MIFLVLVDDFMGSLPLGGFTSLKEAEDYRESQKAGGYGYYNIYQIAVGKPGGATLLSQVFFSNGKEVNPKELSDLFPPEDDEEYEAE